MAQSDGVTGKGLSSPWLAGANLIDKLLDTNHPCHKVLTEGMSGIVGLAHPGWRILPVFGTHSALFR